MNRNTITVVARPKRFEPSITTNLAQNPASPMVLQGLMQILALHGQQMDALSRKIDALAVRPAQQVTALPVQAQPKALPLVEARDNTAVDPPPAPRRRINRSMLREFFD